MSVMEAPMAARGGDGAEQRLTSEIIIPEHHPTAEYFVEKLIVLGPSQHPEITHQAVFWSATHIQVQI